MSKLKLMTANGGAVILQGGATAVDRTVTIPGSSSTTLLTLDNIVDSPADGAVTSSISSNWAYDHMATLHAPVNDIGTPGGMGFGIGVCPSLPEGFSPLSGTFNKSSDEYGNYRYADGSVMCWIPAFYYRIAHASNPTYGTYGVNSVDVKPYNYFADLATANAAGYALHRAFYDGTEQPGFFVDKYLGSNSLGANVSGGTVISIAGGIPIDTDGSQSGVGAISGCGGTNNYGMAQTACKSRGTLFHASSAFIYKALALLSLAHGQSAASSTWCGWYDATGTTNFPKGCNNNDLRDVNDSSVLYVTAGHVTYPNKPKTGTSNYPAKVSHNGQLSGVMDLNGGMWEISFGVTSDGSKYYGLKTSKKLRNLTGANATGADSFFGATGISTNYDDYGTDLGVAGGNNALTLFGSSSQTLSAALSGEGWFATGAGFPIAEGGTNLYGNDGFWDYRPNEMCLISGGNWSDASNAGAWGFVLSTSRTNSNYSVGFRAAAYVS